MAVTILPYPNEINLHDERRVVTESDLRLQKDDTIKPEGYRLEISDQDFQDC